MSDDYLNTVARLEPDITHIDLSAAASSIAISLKRIADSLGVLTQTPVILSLKELTELNPDVANNIEQLLWNAGRSFEQGRRTDR